MKKGVVILLSLFSLALAEELGRPYEETVEGEDVKPDEAQMMMPGMGNPMMGMMGPMGMGGMGGMGGMMGGGMGGMPMNGGMSNCGCQPICQPCMPWAPCQPCQCPCSPPNPSTPGPEDGPVEDGPICVNGAPNEFFPDCCFNGGKGRFCCPNGADNLHCCDNGANNPQCEVATTPPTITTTTVSNGGGGCRPCMPCQPCMIWWMCPPCGCNNGCSTEAPTTEAPEEEIPTAPPGDLPVGRWDPMNCACICAPCRRGERCPPCPNVCPCRNYLS